MSQAAATAIANKTVPSPAFKQGTVIDYYIDDAGTPYNLAMDNLRSNAVDANWTMTVKQSPVP
ncbi:MAG TPA: hypothetical protein VIK18_06290 [Pirellulales bacterium]